MSLSRQVQGSAKHKRIRLNAIVHIIEARQLTGKDSNKLSDPVVHVTVAGKRQSTVVRYNQINATWNQTFMYEDLDLSMDEFDSGLILIQVFHANMIFRRELIGQFSFGLKKVHRMPPPFRHQVFEKWVILTDPENALEEQGYLKCSVTVLGPGDIAPSHERQAESLLINNNERGSHKEEQILGNPRIKRRGYNFAIKVFNGEHLTKTDTWNGTCDPFIVIKFNGIVARTPHRSQTTSPSWNHLLTLPVYTPCFSDTIDLELWDHVRGQPDRLLANRKLTFTSLLGESFPPSWFNFYAKVDDYNTSSGWFCDLVRASTSDIDATAYVGRILMSLNTSLVDKPQSIDRPTAPIKGPKTEKYKLWVDIYRGSELPNSLLGGSVIVEVEFGPEENRRTSDPCKITSKSIFSSIYGNDDNEDIFSTLENGVQFTASNENIDIDAISYGIPDTDDCPEGTGLCQFKEIQVALPKMSRDAPESQKMQLYDIVLNIYIKGVVGAPTRVGYILIKPCDVWGAYNPPEWHSVRGLVNKKGESTTPGQLLIGCNFGPSEIMKERRPMRLTIESQARKSYQLRAYVYQARGISATKENGLCSSFVKISLGGKFARIAQTSNEEKNKILSVAQKEISKNEYTEEKELEFWRKQTKENEFLSCTSVVNDSLDPVWYETLIIDKVELPEPLSLAPDIEIRLCDAENNNESIGRVKFPTSLSQTKFWKYKQRPKWLRMASNEISDLRNTHGFESTFYRSNAPNDKLARINDKNSAGDILIKLQLVECDKKFSNPWWSHQWPKVVPCTLNLGTVGLRHLEEYGFFGSIEDPFVNISVQSIPDMLSPFNVLEKVLNTIGDSEMATDNIANGYGMSKSSNNNNNNQSHLGDNGNDDDDENLDSYENINEISLKSRKTFRELFDKNGEIKDKNLDKRLKSFTRLIPSKVQEKIMSSINQENESHSLFHPFNSKDGMNSDQNSLLYNNGVVHWTNKNLAAPREDMIEQIEVNHNDTRLLIENSTENVDLDLGGDNVSIKTVVKQTEDVIERNRDKRTFFHRVSLNMNMPIDPFYAPSMTIQVMDSRLLGDVVTATTTFNLRDYCGGKNDDFLYTDKLKRLAANLDAVYKIPRFVNINQTYDIENILNSDDDLNSDDYDIESLGDELVDYDDSNESTDANSKDDSEDPSSNIEEAANKNQSFNGGVEDETELLDQFTEGHIMPNTVSVDVNELNVNNIDLTGDLHVIDLNEKEKVDNSSMIIRRKASANVNQIVLGSTWPRENKQSLEINSRLSKLEASSELQPWPFTSFELYRGTNIDNSRIIAGYFKSIVAIRPNNISWNDLRVCVLEFVPMDHYRPVNFKGIEWDFIPLHFGQYVKVLEEINDVDNDDVKLSLIHIIKYRPDANNYDVFSKKYSMKDQKNTGLVPSTCIASIKAAFDALDVSPDVYRHKDPKNIQLTPMSVLNMKQQHVKVRIYVVSCSQLSSRSLYQNSSDPYLVLKLATPPYLKDVYKGVTVVNDKANYKQNTLNPFFGAWFELDAMFPDITRLELQIWNNNYTYDELIGSTFIDLEDRWYNPKWHDLKYKRKQIKEYRPLAKPGSELTQGVVEMWVEMYRLEDAVNAPIVDIRRPTTVEWELRLVVWETRNIPLFDDHNYANLYIRGELIFETEEGVEVEQFHETDSHTGLKDGRGIFNYRMKYKFEAPCKFPRLKLFVWERWLLSHTALGEAELDLSSLIREAAMSVQQKDVIERPRRWISLNHSSWPGQARGDLDIQMSVVTAQYAEKHPVGNARDAPNENPFLSEPPRESIFTQVFRSATSTSCLITCCIVFVLIVVIILAVTLSR